MSNNIDLEVIQILNHEFENNEISEVVFNNVLREQKGPYHLSFYQPPQLSEDEIPELKWMDNKIERLSRTIDSIQESLNGLKEKLHKLQNADDNIYSTGHRLGGLALKSKRLGNMTQKELGQCARDIKQITKLIPRPNSWRVEKYYLCEGNSAKLIDSGIFCNGTNGYGITHYSFLRSSTVQSIKLFTSFRMAPKAGHGTSTTAHILNGKLIVSSSDQTWIS
tara:strand:- start:546 stop:1211 length:666 start_codon:yes stop_codon:yes gene_type:complete